MKVKLKIISCTAKQLFLHRIRKNFIKLVPDFVLCYNRAITTYRTRTNARRRLPFSLSLSLSLSVLWRYLIRLVYY